MTNPLYRYISPDDRAVSAVFLTQSARNRLTAWRIQRYDADAFVARLSIAAQVAFGSTDEPLTKPEYMDWREGERRMLVAVGVVRGGIRTILMTEHDLSMARVYFAGRAPVERKLPETIGELE